MFNVEVALRVDFAAHVARMDGMESGLFNLAEVQRPKYRFPRRAEVLTPIFFVASSMWWPNRWTGGCLYVLGRPKHTIITTFYVPASFRWWLILMARLLADQRQRKEWAMADERESSPRRAGVRTMASSQLPTSFCRGFHVPNCHRYVI